MSNPLAGVTIRTDVALAMEHEVRRKCKRICRWVNFGHKVLASNDKTSIRRTPVDPVPNPL